MNALIEELVLHASAYFATIHAGREPDPVDPFLAKLMAHAIRDRAGIATVEPLKMLAPAGPAKGRNARPAIVAAVAGSEHGLTIDEVADRLGISKSNATWHLRQAADDGELVRRGRGLYLPNHANHTNGVSHANGVSKKSKPKAKAAKRSGTRAPNGVKVKPATGPAAQKAETILRDNGIGIPGQPMDNMVAIFMAFRRKPDAEVDSKEVAAATGLPAHGGQLYTAYTRLRQKGLIEKTGPGRFKLTAVGAGTAS